MKLVHIVQSLSPQQGGLPAAAVGLASAQAHAGEEVHVVYLLDVSEQQAVDDQYGHHLGYDRLIHHRVGGWNTMARLFRSPGRTLAAIAPDWVFVHGVWDPFLVAATRWCRTHQTAWSTVPHSMLHPWHQKRLAVPKRLLRMLGWERLLKDATFLHALNACEQDVLMNLYPTQRVEIVPNGIQLPAFEASADRSEPYALFLNRIGPQKGVDELARHLTSTDSSLAHRWVFAGPDYGCLAEVQDAAACHDRMEVLDAQYGAEKWALLRSASCFVLPSRSEGFSISLLEALACGVPCVITSECNFPEAVAAGAAIEVPLDGTAIVRAVEDLLNDPERVEAMGQAARQLVETQYQWPAIAARLRSTLSA